VRIPQHGLFWKFHLEKWLWFFNVLSFMKVGQFLFPKWEDMVKVGSGYALLLIEPRILAHSSLLSLNEVARPTKYSKMWLFSVESNKSTQRLWNNIHSPQILILHGGPLNCCGRCIYLRQSATAFSHPWPPSASPVTGIFDQTYLKKNRRCFKTGAMSLRQISDNIKTGANQHSHILSNFKNRR
jgi:hypothetical protein